jgi:hypothetical protein
VARVWTWGYNLSAGYGLVNLKRVAVFTALFILAQLGLGIYIIWLTVFLSLLGLPFSAPLRWSASAAVFLAETCLFCALARREPEHPYRHAGMVLSAMIVFELLVLVLFDVKTISITEDVFVLVLALCVGIAYARWNSLFPPPLSPSSGSEQPPQRTEPQEPPITSRIDQS